MAVPQFVGEATVVSQDLTASVPAPAGLQAGDHQLIIAISGTSGSAIAAPDGFSEAGRFSGTISGDDSSWNVSAFIASNATATGVVTLTNPSTSGRIFYAARAAWRGGEGWLPTLSTTTSAETTSHPLPAQTTTAADQLVVAAVGHDTGNGNNIPMSFDMPAPWIERLDNWQGVGFETCAVGVYDLAATGAGSQTGTITSSATGSTFLFTGTLGAASGGPTYTAPGSAHDLAQWHLTLPTPRPSDGRAEQVNQPQLDAYASEFFYLDEQGRMVCVAPTQGATTSGASGATRSELRQRLRGDYSTAAMDPLGDGVWQMTVTLYADATNITGGSNPRKELIVAQIHGAGDSPIPLILSAEYHVATPRLRIFKNSPGFANPVVGITPETPLTIRMRIAEQRLQLWAIAGQVADLPETPGYDWPVTDFTDLTGWYFKAGAYNKTPLTSGSTGEGITKISYLEVLEPGDEPGAPGEAIPTQVTDTGSTISSGNEVSVDVTPPPAGRLVLGVASFNKSAGSIGSPASMASRAQSVGPSVSGDVSSGTATSSATWTSSANYGISAGLFVTNISGWAYRTSVTVADDTDVTSRSADLGIAATPGTVFAVVGVDSSWDDAGAFRSTPPSWGGGYQHIGVFQEAVESTGPAGGAAFAIAKLDVGTGDPTACTVSWTGADQAYLHLVAFDVTEVDGESEPPEDQPGTLIRAPRIGVDKIGLRIAGGVGDVRVDFSTSSAMTNPVGSVAVSPGPEGDAHIPIAPELAPNTTYYYRPHQGAPFDSVRSFRTLPGPGQDEFTFAFASCRATDVDAPVLSQLPARGASMMLFIGDLHYRDLSTTNLASYRNADDEPYTRSAVGQTLTTIPNTQVWDDHDFCGDSSWRGSTGSAQVAQVFRERVPTPVLEQATGGIYHTFTAWGGRARFVVLDCRFYRDQTGSQADGTMLGPAQLVWLQSLLADPDTPITFIVSSVGWQSDGSDDDWGFYQDERATIAGWITDSDTECVFLCGDMHKMAIARPSDNTPGGVHVWHGAALNQFNNGTKGGPYSSLASYHEPGVCGLVTCTDTGAAITASFTGLRQGTSDWSATDSVTVVKPQAVEPGRMLLAT